MRRIALVYSYEPSGHCQAARALEKALAKAGHPGAALETSRLNLSSDLHPFLGPVVAKAYLEVVQRTPGLWEALYDNAPLARRTRELREGVHLLNGLRLRQRLKSLHPDAVVCTHALPCGAVAALKRRRAFPGRLVAVLTDFTAHAYWIHREVDLYLAPCPGAAEDLLRRGVPAERVRVTGIPVDPGFERLPSPESARTGLRAGPGPLALVSGGSKGLGPIPQMVETLCQAVPQADLFVACGANEELHSRLSQQYAGNAKVRPLQFHDKSAELLAAADLWIGKAGGLSAAEALAAGVPAVIYEPIAGQERRNAQYLVRQGAALEAETLTQLGRTVKALLENRARLESLRRSAAALGRPRAARDAAQAIQNLLDASASERRPQKALAPA